MAYRIVQEVLKDEGTRGDSKEGQFLIIHVYFGRRDNGYCQPPFMVGNKTDNMTRAMCWCRPSGEFGDRSNDALTISRIHCQSNVD